MVGGAGPHKQYVRPGLVTSNSAGAGANGKGKETAATAAPAAGTPDSAGNASDTGSGSGEEKVKGDVVAASAGGRKEVIIGGVAFEASKRSLVRKDCESLCTLLIKRSITHALLSGETENEGKESGSTGTGRIHANRPSWPPHAKIENVQTERTADESEYDVGQHESTIYPVCPFYLYRYVDCFRRSPDTSALCCWVYLEGSWFTDILVFFFFPVFGEYFWFVVGRRRLRYAKLISPARGLQRRVSVIRFHTSKSRIDRIFRNVLKRINVPIST